MALIIFIIGIAFVAVALAYDYYHDTQESRKTTDQLTAADTEMKKMLVTERHLRDEISILENKLRHTREDTVTNLLGWQLFEDRVTQNIKESERYHFTMGLMYVDIDEFKVIIDALSYEIGDKLLREVARRLEQCIRQVDSISRFTKDTFVILLAQLAKPETAAIISQRILQSLSQPFQIDDHELYITACIGITLYPSDGQDTQALLRNANHALHLAKKEGKHVSKFYQERMHLQSQRDLIIYNSLSRETLYQEFLLYFQPAMNMHTSSVFCMDVSLRWDHPELGVISTQELFDYSEKQRKLNAISGWLLKSACTQFLTWRAAGFKPQLLGVPLSIKQLENSNFVYQLSHILQELNFNPEWLLVEMKESWLQESMEVLERAFNMLNYLKINMAIDDFGSGSFAFRYLKRGAIRYLKLSPSLVDDVVENEQTRSLIKSLLYFSEAMSIQLIVQGVENEQQLAVLKEIGCTLLQGNYLGAPLSERDVLNKIAIPTT